jgi:hypothetical protein
MYHARFWCIGQVMALVGGSDAEKMSAFGLGQGGKREGDGEWKSR